MKLFDQTELSGIFGESVSIRKVNGRVVVTNRPKRKRQPPTEKELAHRARMSEAARYAKSIADNPAMLALYATGVRKKNESPQSVAIGDFMNAPTVEMINAGNYGGAIGDLIHVNASDDFQVKNVTISIINAQGAVIEEGDAVDNSRERIGRWEYKAVAAHPIAKGAKIVAVAYDWPGNQGRAEIIL